MSISFEDSLKMVQVKKEQSDIVPLSVTNITSKKDAITTVVKENNRINTFSEKENKIVLYSSDNWTADDKYEYYSEYYDDVLSVINDNKTISLVSKQINLTQETNSQFIPFEMPRYYDGFDLQTTNIVFYYVNKNKSDGYSKPINVYYNDEKIRFAWLVDKYVTAVAGEVKFEIQAIGVNSKGDEYVWKTKSASLNILESLSGNGMLPEENPLMSQFKTEIEDLKIDVENLNSQFETEIEDLKNKLADLKSDIEYIDIISINNDINVVEIGSIINTVTINWETNKDVVRQTLNGEEINPTIRKLSVDVSESGGITTDTNFTLVVYDEYNNSDEANTRITFRKGVYYGSVDETVSIDSSVVLTLNKKIQNTKTLTFTKAAKSNERLCYAAPTSYGTPIFTIGGFVYEWEKTTINFINSLGHEESYDVWLSSKSGLSATVNVTYKEV